MILLLITDRQAMIFAEWLQHSPTSGRQWQSLVLLLVWTYPMQWLNSTLLMVEHKGSSSFVPDWHTLPRSVQTPNHDHIVAGRKHIRQTSVSVGPAAGWSSLQWPALGGNSTFSSLTANPMIASALHWACNRTGGCCVLGSHCPWPKV